MKPSGSKSCLNCEAALRGEYCHACGQRDVTLDRGLGPLLMEAVGEAFEADGRLFRTLPAFFLRPGFLVREYLSGRRIRYTSPVRVYIFAALIGFFTLHWVVAGNLADLDLVIGDSGLYVTNADNAPNARAQLEAEEPQGWFEERMAGLIRPQTAKLDALPPDHAKKRVVDEAFAAAPQVMLVMVPLFALVLKLLYWRRRFVDHLVASLNLHSVALLMLALGFIIPGRIGNVAVLAAILAVHAHVLVAMRVVYEKPWWSTILRFAIVAMTYYAMLIAALITIMTFGIMAS